MFTLFKYLVWLVVSLMGLLLATITISTFLVEQAIDAPYDEKLTDFARVLGNEVRADGPALVVRPGALQMLRTDKRDHIYYAIREPDESVVAGEHAMASVPIMHSTGGPVLHDALVNEEPVRVATLQIADPRDPQQRLTVQVAETTNKRLAMSETLRTQAIALPQMLVLVIAILLIIYGYTYVLRPMQVLRMLIDARGTSDLTPLDPDAAPQDLRPLIRSINGLMERLAESIAAQRRFIADAAHQLRTPLAGIKSQTERALVERDPAAVRAALQQLAKGTDHATELANRLLSLARAGTPLTEPPVDVDLGEVVRDTIAEHLGQALARRQDLGFEGRHRPWIVRGDALLLREMLSNLLDNALRYTPDRGSVTVSLSRSEDGAGYTLAVADTGPGVPSAERERVFEPFYRGTDAVAPGTGLGLAIVRTIAAAHNAIVVLGTGEGGMGVRVAVDFPAAPPALAARQVDVSQSA